MAAAVAGGPGAARPHRLVRPGLEGAGIPARLLGLRPAALAASAAGGELLDVALEPLEIWSAVMCACISTSSRRMVMMVAVVFVLFSIERMFFWTERTSSCSPATSERMNSISE